MNPYSQVEFETNRYSVPVNVAHRDLVLKAYPFQIDILHQEQLVASHARCFLKNQDVIEPIHYLPLLEQRPGAFEHAKPMRIWREQLPPIYELLLERLQSDTSRSHGIREFLRILKLHSEYPASEIESAVSLAMEYGCVHADGVQLCLRQLSNPQAVIPSLDLRNHPGLEQRLMGVGEHQVDLNCYQRLLMEGDKNE